MTHWNIFLFVILPYVCLAIMIFGIGWRWKTDQFGWTSRSSETYERTWLRVASPLFHFGIIFVFFGHVLGLIIPQSWTEAIGIDETAYHLVAVSLGSIAALMTIIGLIGLLVRRIVVKSIRLATSRSDIVTYILLLIPIGLGATATVWKQIFGGANGYNYRETISPWLRSLFYFHPDISLMSEVPWIFKAHICAAFLLFAVWPYTRLIHVLSAPLPYAARPYLVYRSRETPVGEPTELRGWESEASYQNDIRRSASGEFVGKYRSRRG